MDRGHAGAGCSLSGQIDVAIGLNYACFVLNLEFDSGQFAVAPWDDVLFASFLERVNCSIELNQTELSRGRAAFV